MPAELVIIKGKDAGLFLSLDGAGARTIGRGPSCDLILLGDKKVSTTHARITILEGERCVLEDLESTNGTYVNGERVHQVPLRSGDRVKIGRSLLVFRTDSASVHLSDLIGQSDQGGSSHASKHASSKAGKSSGFARVDARFLWALQQVNDSLAAPGDLRSHLSPALRAVLDGALAGRALLFLRDPDGGALGCACAIGRDDVKEAPLTDNDVLKAAVNGEPAGPAGESRAMAVPVRFQERLLGALYVDTPGGREVAAGEDHFLVSAAAAIALAVSRDRLARLAGTAVEVVGLAQTPPSRVAVDIARIVGAGERLYGPVAKARGLTFDVKVPGGLTVLGDPLLLSRAFDHLVESALVSAKGGISVAVATGEGVVRLAISRGGPPLADTHARDLVDVEGPSADLRKALARGADGVVALARAAIARSGGRLVVEAGSPSASARYVMELPLAR
ncbi:FHA domain-containing protein [bacterium]|nr:FHA domain-containing protein [bacterium]